MRQISNKAKNCILLLMTVSFMLVLFLSAYEVIKFRDNSIEYKLYNDMEKYCDNIAAVFSASVTEKSKVYDNDIDVLTETIEEVFESYRGGSEIYNILTYDDTVVYYMNEDMKNSYVGYTLNDIMEKFINAGGDNLEELVEYIKMNIAGGAIVSFDDTNEYYLVYYKPFQSGDKVYSIFNCVKASYYLKASRTDEHFVYMMIMLGVILLIFVAIVFATAYIIRKYNKLYSAKDEELFKSQENISELNSIISEKNNREKHGIVKDDTLGIYSAAFMTSFINDAHDKDINVGVAIIGASYKDYYNRSVRDELLNYIKTGIPDNYVFGTLASGHLALLGVNCPEEEFNRRVKQLLNNAEEAFENDEMKTVCAFDGKYSSEDTIDRAVKEATSKYDSL